MDKKNNRKLDSGRGRNEDEKEDEMRRGKKRG